MFKKKQQRPDVFIDSYWQESANFLPDISANLLLIIGLITAEDQPDLCLYMLQRICGTRYSPESLGNNTRYSLN